MSEQKLIKLINGLPTDLRKHIYYDYFHPIIREYTKFIKLLKSDKSYSLILTDELSNQVKLILRNQAMLQYLLLESNVYENIVFQDIYAIQIVRGEKYFKLIECEYTSFTLAMLFILYH